MRDSLSFLIAIAMWLSGGVTAVGMCWASQANRVRPPASERRFPVRAGSLLRVTNRSGSVRISTWSQPEVEVRPIGGSQGSTSQGDFGLVPIDQSGTMELTIDPPGGESIDVEVMVPTGINLQVRTEAGAIMVSGIYGNLTAESQAGDITVALAPSQNVDLSLHSTSGGIRSELPVAIFGRFDPHNLQARLGQGGTTILARTLNGNVSLVPLDGALSSIPQPDPIGSTAYPSVPDAPRTRPVLRTSGDMEIASASTTHEIPTRPVVDAGAIRLETRLVNLNASVTDRSGRAMTDLTKEDFSLYENDVLQEITHFSPTTAPFDLVLLLDLSGSTREKIKVVKEAATRFVDMIGPSDRLGVYAFTGDVYVVSHLTGDRKLLKDRIKRLRNRGGGTAFYHALLFTERLFKQSQSRRKAIVVMTDGVEDPGSGSKEYSFDEVLEHLEESDLIVYPVYLDTEYEMVARRREYTSDDFAVAREDLAELADRTAGVMFRAARAEDLEGTYQKVAGELRTVYSLAYEPINAARDGSWRGIRIKVNQPNTSVRSKKGYYAR